MWFILIYLIYLINLISKSSTAAQNQSNFLSVSIVPLFVFHFLVYCIFRTPPKCVKRINCPKDQLAIDKGRRRRKKKENATGMTNTIEIAIATTWKAAQPISQSAGKSQLKSERNTQAEKYPSLALPLSLSLLLSLFLICCGFCQSSAKREIH